MNMENGVVFLALVVCSFVALASCDGYGHQVYSVPGGGKGKWNMKAKGKGMQNLIHHGGGGGGYEHKHEHKGYEEKHKVVYYPVPIHHHEYKKDDYHGYGSHQHEISVMPVYSGHGSYGNRRYAGEFGDGFGAYGGYGAGYGGYPGEYDRYGSGYY